MNQRIRRIVFDFDGVLVDSNALKRRAYFDIFTSATPAGDVAACLAAHFDGDRYDVIECVVGKLRQRGLEALPVSEYAVAYGKRCDEQMAQRPETAGASHVLQRLATECALFVNSATPEASLHTYIEARGWTPHFRAVLGRPRSKVQNLMVIRSLDEADDSPIVFVGDRQSDLVAARTAGCCFVGMRSDDNDFVDEIEMLETLGGLLEYVRSGEVKC